MNQLNAAQKIIFFSNLPIFTHKIIYLTERTVFPRHFLNQW